MTQYWGGGTKHFFLLILNNFRNIGGGGARPPPCPPTPRSPNIHNCLTRWVASFLQGRSQFTRIDNICSSTKVLRGGIPQGTKLGPVMFAVMAKFVDDLTALEIIPRNSPSMMNFIVDDAQRFAVKNNRCLNPPMCKSMTINFLHYKSCVVSPIVTGGSNVEQVSSFKLLGLFISEDLTWNIHCVYVLKKSNKRLYILRQLFKCGLAKSEIVNVYCTLIRPIIEYASVVFSNLPTYSQVLLFLMTSITAIYHLDECDTTERSNSFHVIY